MYMGNSQRLLPCGKVSPSGLKNTALNYSKKYKKEGDCNI